MSRRNLREQALKTFFRVTTTRPSASRDVSASMNAQICIRGDDVTGSSFSADVTSVATSGAFDADFEIFFKNDDVLDAAFSSTKMLKNSIL